MTLLYVDGGSDFSRWVYRNERCGYWSRAFPLMLEKHGHLCHEIASVDTLDPATWAAYDVVLIGRLREGAWSADAVAAAIEGPTPVIVEGPVPAAIKRALGISARGGGTEDGALTNVHSELNRDSLRDYGVAAGGPVARPAYIRVARDADYDWQNQPRTPIDRVQAAAWRAPGWRAEHWTLDNSDSEILASWERWSSPGTQYPAIVRRGNLCVMSLSVFAFLGQSHTAEPSDGGEHRAGYRVTGVEALVLSLIDQAYSRTGLSRVRVLPWPGAIRWVRNVRHDFDRALTAAEVERVLSDHARVGSAATWYWRAEPRGPAARGVRHAADLRPARIVAEAPNNEVALHTELLWSQAEEEQGMVEAAAMRPVVGTTAHGARNCFRYQGAPNVLWAEARGMKYTEFLGQNHLHPHRCAMLSAEGEVYSPNVLCLPNHLSFDASTSASNRQAVEDGLKTYIRTQGLAQVMNHPDVNQRELFEMLAAMPVEGRADWTAATAADWWGSSHVRNALQIRRSGEHRFTVTSPRQLRGLKLSVRHPDGRLSEVEVDLERDQPLDVAADKPEH